MWSIASEKLSWKAHKLRRIQSLTEAHGETRFLDCSLWLVVPEELFEKVIWSDEKMFVLGPDPQRQNDRILAPVSLNKVLECGKTAGSKCMASTGMIDDKCIPVV